MQAGSELDDSSLLSKYKETGDKALIGVLFNRYTHLVFGVCMKYLKDEEESKDAVMMVFEKLITELKKQEITYFKTWLHSVTKNHCLMKLRSEKKHENFIEIKKNLPELMESSSYLHLNNISEKEEQLQKMEKGIELLNNEQKICIELFYLKEKCYKEITEITGYSLNDVKSYIQNGKRNLKNYLIKNE